MDHAALALEHQGSLGTANIPVNFSVYLSNLKEASRRAGTRAWLMPWEGVGEISVGLIVRALKQNSLLQRPWYSPERLCKTIFGIEKGRNVSCLPDARQILLVSMTALLQNHTGLHLI